MTLLLLDWMNFLRIHFGLGLVQAARTESWSDSLSQPNKTQVGCNLISIQLDDSCKKNRVINISCNFIMYCSYSWEVK